MKIPTPRLRSECNKKNQIMQRTKANLFFKQNPRSFFHHPKNKVARGKPRLSVVENDEDTCMLHRLCVAGIGLSRIRR
jgi:hypothetical protein